MKRQNLEYWLNKALTYADSYHENVQDNQWSAANSDFIAVETCLKQMQSLIEFFKSELNKEDK